MDSETQGEWLICGYAKPFVMHACLLEEKKGASVIRERWGEEVGYESVPRSAVRSADAEQRRAKKDQAKFLFHVSQAKSEELNPQWSVAPRALREVGGAAETQIQKRPLCAALCSTLIHATL